MPIAPLLTLAANGHLALSMEDDSDLRWSTLIKQCRALGVATIEHGGMIKTLDSTIGPHFLLGSTLLLSGWDIWSGYYLMADSPEGDALLRQLHAWLLDQA